MNKDVVYIEPEDDITDIITKIENAKEKIVALVPPKKAGVFRSIVNIKLMAKAGKNAKKTIVLVTTDPAIMKLAGTVKMPVTKNLQTPPTVPKFDIDEIAETTSEEELVENDGDEELAEAAEVEVLEAEAEKNSVEDAVKEAVKEADKGKDEDEEEEKEEKKPEAKKEKKEKKETSGKFKNNPVFAWIDGHRKLSIGLGAGLLVLILVLIWANVIAPAATIDVVIRTTTANFSEGVTFTTQLAEEDVSKGLFYLEPKKIEDKAEVEFEATGKKNVGAKASGDVIIYAYFRSEGAIAVNVGTIFTHEGLNYVAQEDSTLSMNSSTTCDNTNPIEIALSGCLVSARVPVVAEGSGSAYNLSATNTGWSTAANVSVYSDKDISGGTDETITVVQQSDIEKAIEKLETTDVETNKKRLFETIDEDDFVIESSFKQVVGDAVSTPAVGEKVEDGKKAKLAVTTTYSVYVIDDTKVEEFIKAKAKLAEGYKIYEMNDPFIENFTKTESGYVGKLKTSYVSGPEVTAKDIVEVVKGKGFGTGRDDLTKEYSGISKVTINGSFPWVTSFPNDENKITVNIEVGE